MTPVIYAEQSCSWSVNKMGANAQVSFAYLIQPINTSISVGFRYQFYKTVKSNTDQDQYTHYYDHFYGIAASVLYRIEFVRKEEKADEKEQATRG